MNDVQDVPKIRAEVQEECQQKRIEKDEWLASKTTKHWREELLGQAKWIPDEEEANENSLDDDEEGKILTMKVQERMWSEHGNGELGTRTQ